MVVLSNIALLEHLSARVAGLVVKAAAVADRSEFLPCLDYWATKDRLARLDDVVWNAQRLLQRLNAP
jgi:hypothetical protein